MIVLHHCVSARSFRPLWTLEELGLEYELRMLPFPPRVRQKDYLETNPLGTVPALRDDHVFMTESAAICQYLVSRYGPTPLEVLPTEQDFGAFLNWLHFGEATLTFPQTLILRYSRFEPPERSAPQVVEDYTRWFLARLRAVEAALASQAYLCAGRFTAADISVGYALLLASHLDFSDRFSPGVRAYWSRLQDRPAFLRAVQREQSEAVAQNVSTTPAPRTTI